MWPLNREGPTEETRIGLVVKGPFTYTRTRRDMVNTPYRVKPWWLRQLTTEDVWVTIYPYINVPVGVDPLSRPALCAHENVHLVRQVALGKWTWLWRYMTKKQFRLDEEVQGIAAEVIALPESQKNDCVKRYAYQLSSSTYRNAASSPKVAEDLINLAISKRSQP